MRQPLAPMLAVAGEPFDSPDHLFEIKWDGVRGLASVERKAWRLWGRGEADYTPRYPELKVLRQLPAGTILDGELVRLRGGRAAFSDVLRRHQMTSPQRIRWAATSQPVTYMAFDLLALKGRCLLQQPLRERRAHLRELLAVSPMEGVLFSAGVTGGGEAFFEAAIEQQHEGVMAKRLDSRYLPGKRAAVWQKIKPRCEVVCAIIGYTRGRHFPLRSLLLAAACNGSLRFVGQLRRGLSDSVQRRLTPLLERRRCAEPVIACAEQAYWVRPDLYGRVKCFGWSPGDRLRFPSFVGLLKTASAGDSPPTTSKEPPRRIPSTTLRATRTTASGAT